MRLIINFFGLRNYTQRFSKKKHLLFPAMIWIVRMLLQNGLAFFAALTTGDLFNSFAMALIYEDSYGKPKAILRGLWIALFYRYTKHLVDNTTYQAMIIFELMTS